MQTKEIDKLSDFIDQWRITGHQALIEKEHIKEHFICFFCKLYLFLR